MRLNKMAIVSVTIILTMICTIATISLLVFGEVLTSQDSPEVQILQGTLRGKYEETRKGRTFSAFTGIPYAKPPIGDLRFKAPVPARSWEGTLDASKPHVMCPQINPLVGVLGPVGSEDCLFLNVYTPQLTKSNQLLPVIFYIHGGAFVLGSASPDWYGLDILLDKDIVFVTPNYRLGALGFLSTGDDVVPGNNGLKDQNLALKWAKENVAAFGGDPNRITIVGLSAGAASSHYHAVSPLSKDLINGVISHSGSAIAVWTVSPDGYAVKNAQRLAEFVNCPKNSSREMVECLRKVDAGHIIKQQIKYLEWALDPFIPFRPVIEPNIEGAFISEHPRDIIKSGNVAKVPFLTGITTSDGAFKSAGYNSNPSWIKDIDKDFNRVILISLEYGTGKDKLSQKLRNFYFGDKKIDNTTKDELTNMYTDVIFLSSADETVRLHTKYTDQPVYYYLFGYRGSESYTKLFGDPIYDYGTCHADELLYLFTLYKEFPNFKPNESDKKMTEVLTTIWYNFASTGNPTPHVNDIIPVKWEPIQSDNMEYYFIKSADDMQMAEGLYSERAKFIRDLNLYSVVGTDRDEL